MGKKKELSDEEIINAFNEVDNKPEITEILKELFDKKKLLMISDLTRDEISLITRMYVVSKIKKLKTWQIGLDFFIEIVISKNRKSRDEIIKAVSGYHLKNQFQPFNQKGFFGNKGVM